MQNVFFLKKKDGKIPAMLRSHGYSGSCGDWSRYLNYAYADFAVFAMDCRGQGDALTIARAALEPRIKAEIKMFAGLIDTICPPSTQFVAYNKMTCEKDVVIYPNFGHEGFPDSSDITFEFMKDLLD